MSFLKQYGTSAKGNDRLLKQYGGSSGSSPMARQHYATGGKVGANPSLSEGLSAAGADGAPAKPSLARPGRKMPGKGGKSAGKGKTNVNVIIAQAPPKGDAAPMPPPGAGPGGPPMPMPPPGAGGPPMRKHGGAVGKYATGGRIANLGKFAHGGKVRRQGKAWGGEADTGQHLRDKADAETGEAKKSINNAAGSGATAIVGRMITDAAGGRFGRGVGKALTGAGALMTGVDAVGAAKHAGKAREASKLSEEAEGRKWGGRTKHTTKGDKAQEIADEEESGGKYASGGRIKRADGGETPPKRDRAAGELDEGAQRDYVKKRAKDEHNTAEGKTLLGTLGTTAGIGMRAAAGANPVTRALRPLGIPLAVGSMGATVGSASQNDMRADKLKKEGDAFDKADREEAGQRKSGGRICRDGGGPVGLREHGKLVGSGGGLGRLAKMRKYGK